GTMAKDPNQRYATGTSLMAAIDALIAEHPEVRASQPARRRAVPLGEAPAEIEATSVQSLARDKRFVLAGAATVRLPVRIVVAWRGWHTPGPNPEVVQQEPIAPRPVVPIDDTHIDPLVKLGLDKLDIPALLERAERYVGEGVKSGSGERLAFPDGGHRDDLFHEG